MIVWQLFGRLVHPLKVTVFWMMSRFHRTTRPRVVVIAEDELLFIKNWGETQWSFPGGSVHRNEPHDVAAARECFEEVGVSIPPNDLQYLSTIRYRFFDAPFFVYRCNEKPQLKLQKLEIIDSQWVSFDRLPKMHQQTRDLVNTLRN